MLKFLQKLQLWMYIAAIAAAVYVVFFMPVGTGNTPVDQGNAGAAVSTEGFSLYTYLNSIKSAKGKLAFDAEFLFENGDNLKVQSSQQFETKGGNSSVKGSTMYNFNENAAVFDDETYIKDGSRFVKNPTSYVVSANELMDAGNLNLGRIEDAIELDGDVMMEDGISCYKYVGSMTYSDMSNSLRAFIRGQNVNVSDIDNLVLEFTIFVTEGGVPYKVVIAFTDAKCMVKSSALNAKNCTVTGKLTLTFSGFNGVDNINYPAELNGATEGTYVFTDKLSRYMTSTGQY